MPDLSSKARSASGPRPHQELGACISFTAADEVRLELMGLTDRKGGSMQTYRSDRHDTRSKLAPSPLRIVSV